MRVLGVNAVFHDPAAALVGSDVTPAALITSYITEDGIEPGGRS